MDVVLSDKLLLAQAVDVFKKPDFDVFEKAQIIEELVKSRRLKCPKCASKVLKFGKATSPNGGRNQWCVDCSGVVEVIAGELGVSRKVLYEYMKILGASDYTKELVKSGKVSSEKAMIVLSNLKDQKKADEVIKNCVDCNLNSRDIEHLVAEINNPRSVVGHGLRFINVAANDLRRALFKLPAGSSKNEEVMKSINICKKLIDELEVL